MPLVVYFRHVRIKFVSQEGNKTLTWNSEVLLSTPSTFIETILYKKSALTALEPWRVSQKWA